MGPAWAGICLRVARRSVLARARSAPPPPDVYSTPNPMYLAPDRPRKAVVTSETCCFSSGAGLWGLIPPSPPPPPPLIESSGRADAASRGMRTRLGEDWYSQNQQVQSPQERLVEALTQLKLLGRSRMDANKANQTVPGAGGADYYTGKNTTSLIAIDRPHSFPAQLNGKNLKRSVVKRLYVPLQYFLGLAR